MGRVLQVGKVAALVGGIAWTVKSLVIIALNAHFQPMEGVLYFIGVGGILVGAFGLGAFLARRWSGALRWVVFAATVFIAAVVTSWISSLIQEAVANAYTGDNVGLEDEIGILVPGLIWLAVGLFLLSATRNERAPAASMPAS